MATPTPPPRERRPSGGAPISDLKGPIGPPGFIRPKHRRTLTGFGAGEIKSVEGELFPSPSSPSNTGSPSCPHHSFHPGEPARRLEEIPHAALHERRGLREGSRAPCRDDARAQHVQLRRDGCVCRGQSGIPEPPYHGVESYAAEADVRGWEEGVLSLA